MNGIRFYVPKIDFSGEAFNKTKILAILLKEISKTRARLREAIGNGKGADGQPIKPGGYSAAYARRKTYGKVRGGSRGKGVRGTGGQKTPTVGPANSVVNLTLSGDMLGSIQVRSVFDGAEMYFEGDHASTGKGKLSNARLASYLMAKGFEGWFELGKVDIESVEKALQKFADDEAKKLVVVKQ